MIIGGPPCQGFSLANKNRNKIQDDPRNKLFYHFVKFINWYSPKLFVMENVKGLLSMHNGMVMNLQKPDPDIMLTIRFLKLRILACHKIEKE